LSIAEQCRAGWEDWHNSSPKRHYPFDASLVATNLISASARSFAVSEPESLGASQRDVDLMRQIDAVCRRFEADFRAGKSPVIADYLGGVPEAGRSALRSELIGMEQEMRRSDETSAPPDSGPIADAATIAPANLPTAPIPGLGNPSVHEEATVAPRGQATVDLGSSAPAPPHGSEPTRIRYFGDYEIERELARGGMGVVFFARQISLNRPVALKMILAGQLADETDVKRFYSEAEAAANLDHPGIVPIYEVGQHEGQHYFSMGYVEGRSLAQRLADGPLPSREAAALMVKVAQAIEYAHSRGVIHRDLKPGNILLDRNGHPRVTDFGLAKKLQSDSGLTGSGQIMGTPSYMPPVQAGGKRGEVGPAADVYALGATLYALVTGRPPFQAATAMDTVLQVLSDEPVPPRRLNASVPLDLETICLKCLEKEPGKRYSSAAALAEDLRRYLAGEPIVARPVTRFERAVKWARRRPVIAALSAAVVVIALLGLSGILWQWHEAVLARGVAERESERAKAQTELAQRRLYDVQMTLVQRNWEDYNGALLQQGLDDLLPVNQGGIDRRGFEWFYWQRKMASAPITMKGHTKAVSSLAFSRDGSRIVTGSVDDTAKVWDARSGAEALTLVGHAGDVFSAAFSPDGSCIVTGGFDQTAKVWDAGTGRLIRILEGHKSGVSSVTFSPDGQRLASASNNGIVKVWDARTGQMIRTLPGHTFWANSVAFSPNGHHLASGAGEINKLGEMKLWDARTGQETLTFKGHTDVVTSVAFSTDGQRLASASWDGTVKLWDVVTGQETLTLKGHSGFPVDVAFSRDGQRLASAGADETVKVWDARPLDGDPARIGAVLR
jgi:WD40 repeat protein